MVAINKKKKRLTTIDLINEKKFREVRGYLGMSGIGDPCWRKLYYNFHFATLEHHSAKMERIFNAGHLFEPQAIKDLKSIDGVEVYRVAKDGTIVEMTGDPDEEQEEFVAVEGHVKGHNDGRIIGVVEMPKVEMNLELKTMKDKKFQDFVKMGIKKANPVYYSQSQRYMKEMGLRYTFFLAINKNDSTYHSEIIEYDPSYETELRRKEMIIVTSDTPPERHYSSNNYNCNWCNHYGVCHADEMPLKTCRSCKHSDMEREGKWSCSFKKKEISLDEQIEGCESYKIGWGFDL